MVSLKKKSTVKFVAKVFLKLLIKGTEFKLNIKATNANTRLLDSGVHLWNINFTFDKYLIRIPDIFLSSRYQLYELEMNLIFIVIDFLNLYF